MLDLEDVVTIPVAYFVGDISTTAGFECAFAGDSLANNMLHRQLIDAFRADRLIYLPAKIPALLRLFQRIEMGYINMLAIASAFVAVE